MESSPDNANLLFIHMWYDIDRFRKNEKMWYKADRSILLQISLSKFKVALLNYVENKVNRHKCRYRTKIIQEIRTRLHKNDYLEKLNFLNFQIETVMREIQLYYL